MPYNLTKYALTILSSKITMSFSSAYFPVGYDIGDYHIDSAFGFIPSIGDMMFGITAYSIADTLFLGMITDKMCVKNPDLFIQILD